MTVRIGINGLGRIGRCVLRGWAKSGRKDVQIVAVNASGPIERHIHLLKYDSVHGTFSGDIKGTEDSLDMGRGKMQRFSEREPANIPWKKAGVDIVLECTGAFTKRDDAAQHLRGGAKKVLISAPSPDADATIVYKVNDKALKKEHAVISVGSCTTNCLAPVAKALNDTMGIASGFMTTVHSYTNDQVVLDGTHKDLRRARASALSIIPTSTGAAKALGLVLPELAGKLDGVSIRVPTPNVSMVDLCFVASRDTSVEEIHAVMQKAAGAPMKGVLTVERAPLVSVDFNHSPFSAVFDATQTYVVGKRFCRVAAWYDNEWGFSLRMLDVAAMLGKIS